MTELLLLSLLAATVVLFVKHQATRSTIRELEARLKRLETSSAEKAPEESTAQTKSTPEQLLDLRERKDGEKTPYSPPVSEPPRATPPPLPSEPPVQEQEPASDSTDKPVPTPPTPLPPRPVREPLKINWENFLGVKLFAWIGGLALFLGVAFFVKYSFDQGLISPTMRVLIGFATGLGLIAGGLLMPRQRHIITVQTLCATGILILYATLFASHSFYHFLGSTTTFALMAVVTGAAFYLAIHLNAQAVAILGLVGGFLTPPLLSTGIDRPFALFSYIALLDLGLIAVALRQRWNHLTILAAVGTVLMQAGWTMKFFAPGKELIAMAIFLAFSTLFVGVAFVASRLKTLEKWISTAALLLPASAFGFAFFVLTSPHYELVQQPHLLFGYLFLVDIGIIAVSSLRTELRICQFISGAAAFGLLAIWTLDFLSVELLNVGLGCYLVFSLLHAVVPVLLQKIKPAPVSSGWGQFFPPAALLLILIPLFRLTNLSDLLWPIVLLINLIAIILAISSRSLVSILAVFVLTVIASALWIFRVPPTLEELPGMLALVGGFAVFFMAAAVMAARLTRNPDGSLPGMFGQSLALGTFLPFLLITLMILRLPLPDPNKVFGLAAGLSVLLLLLGRYTRIGLLAPATLIAVMLPQYVWFLTEFTVDQAGLLLGWTAGFATLFFAYPFVFERHFAKESLPWKAAALALPAHYFILHQTIKQGFPNDLMGVLPATLAVPCFLGLLHLIKTTATDNPIRNTQLALFGGSTIFFITLIFPVQFDRQWVTLGWALEGIGFIWLFHRIPHPRLKHVGVALLVAAFVRLGLNPEVFQYKTRLGPSIFNWYLYTYSIVSLCLIGGARLLAPPRNRISKVNVPPLLYSLGAVLAFMLLNIEIANFFSTGDRLSFHWSGNLAQDMTYSLGWALFALGLLGIGFKIDNAATRYSGMGLLIITLLKLFLHDLWQLGGLYRIGSLVGLAIVLILVSFIYQRFLTGRRREVKEE